MISVTFKKIELTIGKYNKSDTLRQFYINTVSGRKGMAFGLRVTNMYDSCDSSCVVPLCEESMCCMYRRCEP